MVNYIQCSSNEFIDKLSGKDVVVWGTGRKLRSSYGTFKCWFEKFMKNIIFFVDSEKQKQGTGLILGNHEFQIMAPESLNDMNNIVLLICGSMDVTYDIVNQLDKQKIVGNIDCYFLVQLLEYGVDFDQLMGITKIPKPKYDYYNEKIIHCCWLSGEEKPQIYKECIESWKKYCPGYRIIEWTANNYDVSKNQYMYEAYKRKKWAFASDYIRLDVVHQYGGIYLDMDVELLANLDFLLHYKSFFCLDSVNYIDLGTAFGAKKGDALVKKMLDEYEELKFVTDAGEMDVLPQPKRMQHVFEEFGIDLSGYTNLKDDNLVLSTRYAPVFDGDNSDEFPWKGTELMMHWHNGGWLDLQQRCKRIKNQKTLRELKTVFPK